MLLTGRNRRLAHGTTFSISKYRPFNFLNLTMSEIKKSSELHFGTMIIYEFRMRQLVNLMSEE